METPYPDPVDAWDADAEYRAWRAKFSLVPIGAALVTLIALGLLLGPLQVRGPTDYWNKIFNALSWEAAVWALYPLYLAAWAMLVYYVYGKIVVAKQQQMLDPVASRDVDSQLKSAALRTAAMAQQLSLEREVVDYFMRVSTSPDDYFVRISESIHQYTRSMKATAAFSLLLPQMAPPKKGEESPQFVVPLVWAWRGALEDGLHVTDGDTDRRLSTLSSSVAAAHVVRCMFQTIEPDLTDDDKAEFWEADGLGAAIAAYALEGAQGGYVWSKAHRAARGFRIYLMVYELQTTHFDDVFAVLARLGDRFPICVAAPEADGHDGTRDRPWRVTVERRSVATRERAEVSRTKEIPSLWSDLLDAIWNTYSGLYRLRYVPRLTFERRSRLVRIALSSARVSAFTDSAHAVERAWTRAVAATQETFVKWIGVGPSTFAYPLDLAGSTRSYHMSAIGPEDTYMARQALILDDNSTSERTSVPHTAFSQALGQRHSHVYVADAGGTDMSDASYAVTYFARPPTSVSRATWVAGVGALVVLVAGKVQLDGLGSGSGSDGGAVVQVLLALPLAMATVTWSSKRQQFWSDALFARAVFIATMFIVSAALVLGSAHGWFGDDQEILGRIWTGMVLALIVLASAAALSERARILLHRRVLATSRRKRV